jgi:hydroxyethylthiazole kinase-like uncharacterized protein yjeF
MRAIEQAAMTAGRATGADLMDRAARGVVDAVMARWPALRAAPHRAVILAGPGNNGGDGYVIGRLLRWAGWDVAAFALAPPATPDAIAARDAYIAAGGTLPDRPLEWSDLDGAPLVVDAMFGAGLMRDIAPGVWGMLTMAQESRCPLVAVDIPSGLCADSGRIRSPSGWINGPVDLTVTFQRPRPGHYLDPAAAFCGDLVVVDIGLERELDALLRGPDADDVIDLTRPQGALAKTAGHKYAHGHALILAGGPGEGGAARLSARGALRIGAGLVTVACPLSALAENSARMDTIMLRPLHDGAALGRLLEDPRYNAICLGPGIGHDRARDLAPVALRAGRPVVLDADALSAWEGRPAALFALLHDRCVLTPHGGEFRRLFPDLAARLAAPAGAGPAWSKVDATREAARRAGCTVLFKGADTVIATPQGSADINAGHHGRAAPWLATAGSGDVLAGFITGLLARGLRADAAARSAAWLHVECARTFGPGLIAEDLPEQLPAVFRALGL